jgi:hypothetical protein
VSRPALGEVLREISQARPVPLKPPPADLLEQERARR